MKDERTIEEKIKSLKELGVNVEVIDEKDIWDEDGNIKKGTILGKVVIRKDKN